MANKITESSTKVRRYCRKTWFTKSTKRLYIISCWAAAAVEKRFPWHTPQKPRQGFLDKISETGGECGCDMGLR